MKKPQAQSMSIALVCDRVYPYFKGGAEKRYLQIAEALISRGHRVHFYTGQWPGMAVRSSEKHIVLEGVYRVGSFYSNGHKSIKESIIYALNLLPTLILSKHDIIECDQFPLLPIFVAKIASLIRGVPLVVTWHEVWGVETWLRYLGRTGWIGALIEWICLRLPDHIISVSEFTTNNLAATYGIDSSRISTISNGIDNDKIRNCSPSSDRSDIVFVGRLLEHKNVDVLLRSVALVKRSWPNVQCRIVGDGPQRQNLEKLMEELDLGANVRIIGSVEDDEWVYSLMRSSKLLVHPSTREGFGITVVEANACGIPALVINHPDNAACDLVHDGMNGYICDLDHREIATKVMQLLNGDIQCSREQCEKSALQFDRTRMCNEIISVYSETTEGKKVSLIPESAPSANLRRREDLRAISKTSNVTR